MQNGAKKLVWMCPRNGTTLTGFFDGNPAAHSLKYPEKNDSVPLRRK